MIDNPDPVELDAAMEVLAKSPRGVSAAMSTESRAATAEHWVSGLQERATTLQEERVLLVGAGAKHGSDKFTLVAADSMTPLSGGLVPSSQYAGTEFGAIPKTITVKRLGRTRKQVTGRQFRYRNPEGYLVFRTVREITPALVSAWVKGAILGMIGDGRMRNGN